MSFRGDGKEEGIFKQNLTMQNHFDGLRRGEEEKWWPEPLIEGGGGAAGPVRLVIGRAAVAGLLYAATLRWFKEIFLKKNAWKWWGEAFVTDQCTKFFCLTSSLVFNQDPSCQCHVCEAESWWDGTKCKDWSKMSTFFFNIYICFNSLQPTDPAEFHSSLCSFLWPPLCSCPSLKASILPSQLSDSNWTLACCWYWGSSVSFLGCYISLKDVIKPLASGRSSSCLHVMQKATESVFSLWRLHQPLPGYFSLLSL